MSLSFSLPRIWLSALSCCVKSATMLMPARWTEAGQEETRLVQPPAAVACPSSPCPNHRLMRKIMIATVSCESLSGWFVTPISRMQGIPGDPGQSTHVLLLCYSPNSLGPTCLPVFGRLLSGDPTSSVSFIMTLPSCPASPLGRIGLPQGLHCPRWRQPAAPASVLRCELAGSVGP